MTVHELIKKLQALEDTYGDRHVFYDEAGLWVNFNGVQVREMNFTGDWASYVALVAFDPDVTPRPAASSSS